MTAPIRYAFSYDGLLAALGALGGTPDEIADSLRVLGVRGVPGHTYRCALAKYLATNVEDATSAVVAMDDDGGLDITVRGGDGQHQGVSIHDTPYEFVLEFDGNAYPDLIEEAKTDA